MSVFFKVYVSPTFRLNSVLSSSNAVGAFLTVTVQAAVCPLVVLTVREFDEKENKKRKSVRNVV